MAAQQLLKIVYALDIKFWVRWLRIADIYILYIIVRANFVLITRKEGGA